MIKITSTIVPQSHKSIWVMVILGLVIISLSPISVYAMEFDNSLKDMKIDPIKQLPLTIGEKIVPYNSIWEKYPPVEINNWFGLGEVLMSGAITEHTDSCSNDCEDIINIYQANAGVLIDDIRFYTLILDKNGDEIDRYLQPIRNYQLKIESGTHLINVSDYDYVCVDMIMLNGTNPICDNVVIGSHEEEVSDWTPYNIGDSLPSGNYVVKLSGEKKYDRTVDWQIKSQGQWITDWSVWGSVTENRYEYNSNVPSLSRDSSAATSQGATFTINTTGPNVTFAVSKVQFKGYRSDAVDFGDVTIGIRNTDGTLPIGNDLVNGSIASTSITTDGTGQGKFYNISMSNNNTLLYKGNKYAMVIRAPGATETYSLQVADAGGYAGGTRVSSSDGGSSWTSTAGSLPFYIFGIESSVATLNSPVNYYNSSLNTIILNASAYVSGVDSLMNMSLYKDGIYNTTNIVTGNLNSTIWTLTLPEGTYNWSVQACDTSYSCGFANENRTFTIDSTTTTTVLNSPINNYVSYDSNVTFNASIVTTGAITPMNMSLYIDDILNQTNTVIGSSNESIWSVVLPDGSHNWTVKSCSSDYECNTAVNRNFTVDSSFDLTLCNTTNNVPFINFTFKNEISNANINASNDLSTFIYNVHGSNVVKTYSFTNTTTNPSYAFCVTPGFRQIDANISLKYSNTNYPQRTFSQNGLLLTNITNNKILHLLDSGSGLYVTFQVITLSQQVIPDSLVNITLGGSEVESRLTDGAGTATFWLNPLTTYTVSASKSGYSTATTSITPTQTSYTITLGSSQTSSASSDLSKGIITSVSPKSDSLINDTTYNFNFTISSSYWQLSQFGFYLSNSTTILGSTSSTSSSGGIVSISKNTLSSNQITMNYYWVINGTYSNSSRTWYIQNTGDTDNSLITFKNDLKNYLTSGIFGLNDFSLNIIIFLLIFVITGVVSYKFAITSPAAILALVFFMVIIFDVGLGLIYNPINAVPNFPTIFIFIIMVGLFIRELPG